MNEQEPSNISPFESLRLKQGTILRQILNNLFSEPSEELNVDQAAVQPELNAMNISRDQAYALLRQAVDCGSMIDFEINVGSEPAEILNLIKHQYLVDLIVNHLTDNLLEKLKTVPASQALFGNDLDPEKIKVNILNQGANSKMKRDVVLHEIDQVFLDFFASTLYFEFINQLKVDQGDSIMADYSYIEEHSFQQIYDDVSTTLSNRFLAIED